MPAPAAPRKRPVASSSSSAKTPASDELASKLQAVTLGDGARTSTRTSTETASGRSTVSRLTRKVDSGAAPGSTQGPSKQRPLPSSSRVTPATLSAMKASLASAPPLDPAAQLSGLSKQINGHLSTLASASCTSSNAEKTYREASLVLERLRALIGVEISQHRKRIDVEKAAVRLVGHLNDKKLYELSLQQLGNIKASLCSLYAPPAHHNSCSEDALAEQVDRLSLAVATNGTTKLSTAKRKATPLETIKNNAHLLSFVPFPTSGLPSTFDDAYNIILIAQHYALTALFVIPLSQTSKGTERLRLILSSLRMPSSNGPLEVSRSSRGRSGEIDESKQRKVGSAITAIYGLLINKAYSLAGGENNGAGKEIIDHEAVIGMVFYAIECLLENGSYFSLAPADARSPDNVTSSMPSESTADPALDSLSNTLKKWIHFYGVKSMAAGTSETEVAEKLQEPLSRIFGRLSEMVSENDKARLSRCKAFGSLLDLLSKLASRGENTELASLVANLRGSPRPYNDERAPLSEVDANSEQPEHVTAAPTLSADQAKEEIKKHLATFTSEYVKLSSWIKGGYAPSRPFCGAAMIRCLAELGGIVQRINPDEAPLFDAKDTVSALLRLKERTGRALRASPLLPDSALSTLTQIMEAFISFVEQHSTVLCKREEASQAEDLLAGTVDSLHLLARKTLVIDQPVTFKATLDLYNRAVALLPATTTSGRLSLVRAITNNIHNVAGVPLYNAEKHANAISFMKLCCHLTEAELQLCNDKLIEAEGSSSVGDDKQRSATQKDIGELGTQLPMRLELLALAQAQIRDRLEAAVTLEKALAASWAMHARRATDGNIAAWQSIESDAPFTKLLSRYTRLVVFDLLRTPEDANIASPLGTRLSANGIELSSAEKGLVMEMQAKTLDSHTHRPEALQMLPAWLALAQEEYQTSDLPLRATRTIVRRMELSSTMLGDLDGPSMLSATAQVAALTSRLHTSSEGTLDTALVPFAAQYQAFSRIWLAFEAIRRKEAKASKILAKEAKEALAILRETWFSTAQKQPQDSGNGSSPINGASETAERLAVAGRKTGLSTAKAAPAKNAAQPATRPLRRTAASTSATVPNGRNNASASVRAASPRKPLSPKQPAASGNKMITPPRNMPKSPSSGSSSKKQSSAPQATPSKRLQLDGKLDDVDRTLSTLQALTSLLGAFGHTFLRGSYLRLLKRLLLDRSADEFVGVCCRLSTEYLQLGKVSRSKAVLEQAEAHLLSGSLPTKIVFYLRQAEYHSYCNRADPAMDSYLQALTLSERDDNKSEKSGSLEQRIIVRARTLHRTALAAEVYASIQWTKGAPSQALSATLQSLRLANRAMSNLERMSAGREQDQVPEAPASDPFVLPAGQEEGQGDKPLAAAVDLQEPGQVQAKSKAMSASERGLGWEIAHTIVSALLSTATMYSTRGSSKQANYFLTSALELATDLNAPRLKAKIVTRQLDLSIALASDTAIQRQFASLAQLASEDGGLSTIEVMRIKAHLSMDSANLEEAEKGFVSAKTALEKLDKTYGDTEAQIPSPQKKSDLRASQRGRGETLVEAILPFMQSQVLRSHIWLLCLSDRCDEVTLLLRKLVKLANVGLQRAEDVALEAKVKFYKGMAALRKDPIMGLLAESVLSIPLLGQIEGRALSAGRREAIRLLQEVELLLLGAASMASSCSSIHRWKEICTSVASLRLLQATLGKRGDTAAIEIASALEAGTAITLRREMLDGLNSKLAAASHRSDTEWPSTDSATVAHSEDPSRAMWLAMQARYASELSNVTFSVSGVITALPVEWAVLSLHLAADRQSIIAIRYESDRTPFILQLPLDRLGKREADDDLFTFDYAHAEMADIIEQTNLTCSNAKSVTGTADNAAWWKQRKELEMRLAALLVAIDQRWFGAFKHVLTRKSVKRDIDTQTLDQQLEVVLRKAILSAIGSRATSVDLDSTALSCFHALDKTCSNDDLEDLLLYVIDSYQFCGIQIPSDEIDIDQAVVDIRIVLEEHLFDKPASTPPSRSEDHLFLILDKSLHCFPWESIPILDGRSISRLPSLSFLQDRLSIRDQRSGGSAYPGVLVDAKKTFYALNPGGDLKNTQAVFEKYLLDKGWDGICGRKPMEEELRQALSSNDLFLFFGHGGAQQYIRQQVIRTLPSCATPLLWGCSSGYLEEAGEFEATGVPWTYMLAGAPAVVANLWDVTDKDIDRFTQSTLEDFGLGQKSSRISLPSALAAARKTCRLRYLNGAAPVIWGIPVKVAQ